MRARRSPATVRQHGPDCGSELHTTQWAAGYYRLAHYFDRRVGGDLVEPDLFSAHRNANAVWVSVNDHPSIGGGGQNFRGAARRPSVLQIVNFTISWSVLAAQSGLLRDYVSVL